MDQKWGFQVIHIKYTGTSVSVKDNLNLVTVASKQLSKNDSHKQNQVKSYSSFVYYTLNGCRRKGARCDSLVQNQINLEIIQKYIK